MSGAPEPTTAQGYDRVAEAYAAHLADELDRKPFDRGFLDRIVAALPPGARVLDLGCGPGHVGRYLGDRGLEVTGLDVSPAMVAAARRLHPQLTFVVGDLLRLGSVGPPADAAVAFYSIVHFEPAQLAPVFRNVAAVLRPGGPLALSFHVGDETRHFDELFGVPTSLDFTFFPTATVVGALEEAGFAVEECIEREPYAPEVEAQTRRCYVVARRTARPGA